MARSGDRAPYGARGNGSQDERSLRFAVLGPVRAWHGPQELDLGSPQQRLVLAVLLLRRGRPVTVAQFIDAVWGEEPPVAAVSVLRTYVSRLRKALEPIRASGQSPKVIVSAADGYMADVAEDALDLGVFEQRVARARKLRDAGELAAAAELLHTALDGWHEPPLAGLPGPLAQAERSRLEEKRMSTLEACLDIDVQLGRHDDVIGELRALADKHPLRERLCQLLMLALYRSGRQAEALACYHRTRRTLVVELGVEPAPPLQDLHDRILAADPSLHPTPPSVDSHPQYGPVQPSAGYPVHPAQLPADLPTFTGRTAELDQARALLPAPDSPPTTLVIAGMAGTGKTTLAVHWAHEIADHFPDGQLFVNLRGFDPASSAMTPEEAIRLFLDSLGVHPQRIPAYPEAQAALYRSILADRRVLIVLDNARDVDQIRPLLPGAPGCLVIVTSRDQLTGLIAGHGAHTLTLHQLTPADANALLTRRLGTERTATQPLAVEEIIARCGRLPLALAIVAARAATHPGFALSAIADELRESHGSLDAFASGELTTDVRAVFSWSYEALSAPAARLFRLLALHPGRNSVSEAAMVALAQLPPRETRRLLAELTRAHLLTESLPRRYTTHDLLSVYAAEQLRADEPPAEQEPALQRILSWYLHTVDSAYPILTPNRVPIPALPLPSDCRPLVLTTHEEAVRWCEDERANLVAAVHRAAVSASPGVAWRLAALLWGFFHLRRHLHDWLDASQSALAAAHATNDRMGEMWSLGGVADALTELNRFEEAIDHYERQMVLCQELGDGAGAARSVVSMGTVHLRAGRLGKAVEYSRHGLTAARANGCPWGEGMALTNLGDAHQRLGRFDEASDYLEEALATLRTMSNRWFEGNVLHILGTIDHRLCRHDDAVRHYHQALEAHRDVGNRWGEGHTLGDLAELQLVAGEPEAARTSWRQALAVLAEFDEPHAQSIRARLRDLDHRIAAGPPRPRGPQEMSAESER